MFGLRATAVAVAGFALWAGAAGAATGPAASGSGTWDNGQTHSFSFDASGLGDAATGSVQITEPDGVTTAHVTCLSVGATMAELDAIVDASPFAAGVGKEMTVDMTADHILVQYGTPVSRPCVPQPTIVAAAFPLTSGAITLAGGDPTPPEVTPVVTGTLGQNGWYTSDVHVSWDVADPESGSWLFTDYCGDADITSDVGNTYFLCWAQSSGGLVRDSTVVRRDATPPVLHGAPTTSANANGWWNHDVTVRWTCGDALSGVTGCPAASVVGEGAHQSVSATVGDNAGNSTAATVSDLNVDETRPTIVGLRNQTANANGWYDAPVTVTYLCRDALSGIASCSSPVTLGEGVDQSASGDAVDLAGNTANAGVVHVNVDLTAPTLTVSGDQGTYGLADTVAISCSASDALSGVASTTCADVNGPAWQFGPGTHTSTVQAIDRAGNVGNATFGFTVVVTADGLERLIGQLVANADVAASLEGKIASIASASNANAKAGKLRAFDNEVAAQTGKALDASTAALLERFAAAL